MNRKLENEARRSNKGKAAQSLPWADVPPLGVFDKKIRCIDLEPRSNGENKWQDEWRDQNGAPSSDGA